MSDITEDQDRIESDLARTRARMDNRLDALQDRLSPGQILDDLMGYVRSSEGGDFARNLMDSVRGNPMPAALTGIGLAWLMASHAQPAHVSTVVRPDISQAKLASAKWRSREELERAVREAETAVVRAPGEPDTTYLPRWHKARGTALGVARETEDTDDTFAKRVEDALSAARQGVADAWDGLSERASAATQHVKEAAQGIGDQVSENAQAARQMSSNLMATITDNPVLLGAVGVALGALLGALVPQSEQEEAALSGMADSAREAGRDMAQSVVDRGGQVAQQVLEAGRDSAQAQGLTGEKSIGNLANDALSGDLVSSVKQVAQDVLNKGEAAIRQEGGDVASDLSKASATKPSPDAGKR